MDRHTSDTNSRDDTVLLNLSGNGRTAPLEHQCSTSSRSRFLYTAEGRHMGSATPGSAANQPSWSSCTCGAMAEYLTADQHVPPASYINRGPVTFSHRMAKCYHDMTLILALNILVNRKELMAGQAAENFVKKSPKEDGLAYQMNYAAHKEGITRKEMANYYDTWADTYETDVCGGRYNGPTICADFLAKYYKEDRETIKILDVAAGTGFLGEKLHEYGFKTIDALDPSEKMLEIAKSKDIYEHLICDTVGDHDTDIAEDTYDCLAIAGGMGEGHIPREALREMVRIVKPGGIVCIVMREEYLSYVSDYKGKLEPLMDIMIEENAWKRISRTTVENYSFSKNGVVFIFEVL